MAGIVNLALQSLVIGSGLTLSGSTLSVTPGQSTVDSVTAPAGSTLTLAANDGTGGAILLGLSNIVTSTAAWQGIVFRTNNQSGNYTLTATDLYCGYTGAGGHTFTLPAAASHTGRLYIIKARAGLTVDVTGGGELWTDSAVLEKELLTGECLTVVSDGTYWIATGILSGVIVV